MKWISTNLHFLVHLQSRCLKYFFLAPKPKSTIVYETCPLSYTMARGGGNRRRKGKEVEEHGEGSGTQKLDHKKSKKGADPEWDIFDNHNLKAYAEWENVPEPWSLANAIKYVGFPHIDRWCDRNCHSRNCKSKSYSYNKIDNIEAKWRCLEILRFLTDDLTYDRHKIPKKVVCMVYVELELQKTVKWSTLYDKTHHLGALKIGRLKYPNGPPPVIPSVPVPDWFRNDPRLFEPKITPPPILQAEDDDVDVQSPTADEAVFDHLMTVLGVNNTGQFVSESIQINDSYEFDLHTEASTHNVVPLSEISPMDNADGGNFGRGLATLADVATEMNQGGVVHESYSDSDMTASQEDPERAMVAYSNPPSQHENIAVAVGITGFTPNVGAINFVQPKPNRVSIGNQSPLLVGQDGIVEEGVLPNSQDSLGVDTKLTTVISLQTQNYILRQENERLKAENDDLRRRIG